MLSSEAPRLSWSRDIPNSVPEDYLSILSAFLTHDLFRIASSHLSGSSDDFKYPFLFHLAKPMGSKCCILINQILLTSLKAFTQELNPPFELELVNFFPSNLYIFIHRHLVEELQNRAKDGKCFISDARISFRDLSGYRFPDPLKSC